MSAGILAIFFSEFDNIVGPKIVHQAPSGFISPEDFDAVSEYTITKPDLCGKVVSVLHPTFRKRAAAGSAAGQDKATTDAAAKRDLTAALLSPGQKEKTTALSSSITPSSDNAVASASANASLPPAPMAVRFVSFPVGLSHERYLRNTLLYSVGFVLPADADASPYEPVLRKLGLYLFSMEIESGFLFRPERKAALADLLPAILHGLNARGECFVAVDECDTIALKLFPPLPAPPVVKDSDVPVRVRDLDVLLGSGGGGGGGGGGGSGGSGSGAGGGGGQDSGLDLCIRMILPHIDGRNFVRAIAEAADVDISLVRKALQHLSYYGCVVFIDTFCYSNIYATQPRVQLLLRSRELSEACLRYISQLEPITAGEDGSLIVPTLTTTTTTNATALAPLATGTFPSLGEFPALLAALARDPEATAAALVSQSININGTTTTSGTATAPSSIPPLLPAFYSALAALASAASSSSSGSTSSTGSALNAASLSSIDLVFNLYSAFGAGTRASDICAQGRTAELGIDDRRFISFGVMHGLIRRLHKYPVPVSEDAVSPEKNAAAFAVTMPFASSSSSGPVPLLASSSVSKRRTDSPSTVRSSRPLSRSSGVAKAAAEDEASSSSALLRAHSPSSPSPPVSSSTLSARKREPSAIRGTSVSRKGISSSSSPSSERPASANTTSNNQWESGALVSSSQDQHERDYLHHHRSDRSDLAAEKAAFNKTKRLEALFYQALPLLDGCHNEEEICCQLACSQAALEECLTRHGGFVYVVK